MDIIITAGLMALLGLCYVSMTLTSAPAASKHALITVPAGDPRGRFGVLGVHAYGTDAATATRRSSFGNPQTLDHRTVWRSPHQR